MHQISKDWEWISSHNDLGVEMEDVSDDYSLSHSCAKSSGSYASINRSRFSKYEILYVSIGVCGKRKCNDFCYRLYWIWRFEIYVKNADAIDVWKAVLEAGKEYNIKPIGLAARDTLRLEMGFCLYGNDIDDLPPHWKLDWDG